MPINPRKTVIVPLTETRVSEDLTGQVPWTDTARCSYKHSLLDPVDLHRHFRKNVGTKSIGGADIHHGDDTHNELCCNDLVAYGKQPSQAERTAKTGLPRYHGSHGDGFYCCN